MNVDNNSVGPSCCRPTVSVACEIVNVYSTVKEVEKSRKLKSQNIILIIIIYNLPIHEFNMLRVASNPSNGSKTGN